MDPATVKLIRKLCAEFKLSPDVEFTCYEAYIEYFGRYFADLEARFNQTALQQQGNDGHLIDTALDEVEKTSLLHTLALISICAKYVNGHRCAKLFIGLSDYLEMNGTPFSVQDIRYSEYVVFKFLGFNIKPSDLYAVSLELASEITQKQRDVVQFDQLHDACIALLRLIYRCRDKFDEIICFVKQQVYGFDGNEQFKLSAAIVYASTMLINPRGANWILNEIISHTYLNESLLRKLGQSMHSFFLDETNA